MGRFAPGLGENAAIPVRALVAAAVVGALAARDSFQLRVARFEALLAGQRQRVLGRLARSGFFPLLGCQLFPRDEMTIIRSRGGFRLGFPRSSSFSRVGQDGARRRYVEYTAVKWHRPACVCGDQSENGKDRIMNFDDLTGEQKANVRAAKKPEKILELA